MRGIRKGAILRHTNPVSIVFFLLSLLGLLLSGMRPTFVVNELIIRFIRDGVMVLALIVPINAGMGLNFAIVVRSICNCRVFPGLPFSPAPASRSPCSWAH